MQIPIGSFYVASRLLKQSIVDGGSKTKHFVM